MQWTIPHELICLLLLWTCAASCVSQKIRNSKNYPNQFLTLNSLDPYFRLQINYNFISWEGSTKSSYILYINHSFMRCDSCCIIFNIRRKFTPEMSAQTFELSIRNLQQLETMHRIGMVESCRASAPSEGAAKCPSDEGQCYFTITTRNCFCKNWNFYYSLGVVFIICLISK